MLFQAAKPLGTVVEVLQFTSVLLTSYSNFGDDKYMSAIVYAYGVGNAVPSRLAWYLAIQMKKGHTLVQQFSTKEFCG